MNNPRKNYGNTRVDGHGVVHLGDKHVVNYHYVDRAFFSLNNESACFEHAYRQALQTPRYDHSGNRSSNQPRIARRLRNAAPDLASKGKGSASTASYPSQTTQYVLQSPTGSAQLPPLPLSTSASDRSVMAPALTRLLSPLAYVLRFPNTSNILSTTNWRSSQQSATQELVSHQYRNNLEFLLLCFMLITFITGRNVSMEEFTHFLIKCSNDSFSHPVTFLLGFGVCRYLYFGSLSRTPSQVGGDYFLLEDAFGVETMVSMSLFEDISIMESFLDVHYRGSPGERLVRARRFNFMLNSRRGYVISPSELCRKRSIRSRARIVMAVYLTTTQAKCTECTLPLAATTPGEFCCRRCDRVYRDCGMLKYLFEAMELSANRYHHHRASASGRSPTSHEDYSQDAEMMRSSRTRTLKHVDFAFMDPTEAQQSAYPKPMPILGDALNYLDYMRIAVGHEVQLYNDFLDVMKDFKEERIEVLEVIIRVEKLFSGYPMLISRFSLFLPPGYEIACGKDRYSSPNSDHVGHDPFRVVGHADDVFDDEGNPDVDCEVDDGPSSETSYFHEHSDDFDNESNKADSDNDNTDNNANPPLSDESSDDFSDESNEADVGSDNNDDNADPSNEDRGHNEHGGGFEHIGQNGRIDNNE